MNLQRVESFARELHAIISEADKAQQRIDQINGQLAITDKFNDLKQTKALSDQRAEVQRVQAQLAQVAAEKANRPDVEGARSLVGEIMVRVQLAQQEYGQLQAAMAEFEFQTTAGHLDTDQRAMAEADLDRARQRVELRVKLAGDLLPNKSIVLLT